MTVKMPQSRQQECKCDELYGLLFLLGQQLLREVMIGTMSKE